MKTLKTLTVFLLLKLMEIGCGILLIIMINRLGKIFWKYKYGIEIVPSQFIFSFTAGLIALIILIIVLGIIILFISLNWEWAEKIIDRKK